MDTPGIGRSSFKIAIDKDWFKKGDILENPPGIQIEVTKVYRITWWKKLLMFLGFKVVFFKGIKVKIYVI